MSHTHLKEKPPYYINNIANTVVLKSSIHGFGLFCTEDIPEGTLLCEISGQIINVKDYNAFIESNLYPKEVFIEKSSISPDLIIAMPFRTSYSFINHHNDIFHIRETFDVEKNVLKVYSTRNIKKGEELFDRYNLEKHIDILGGFKKH